MQDKPYNNDDLLDPRQLTGKLRDAAYSMVVEALAQVVYKELLARAAQDAWQLSQHGFTSLGNESALEELFGGDVSTTPEQREIAERIEQYRATHLELNRELKRIKPPELPGLVRHLQQILANAQNGNGKRPADEADDFEV
ncbi:MAG: hypothetical protein FOGNACKC_06230 [Anaerolineae bacterium]|nr:hypothetical protein [Anaerolineae bacterium]